MKSLSLMTTLLCVVLLAAGVAMAQERRNPFGVADVLDPLGPDVRRVAEAVHLSGDSEDRNAKQWSPKISPGKRGRLDGDWFGRWEVGTAGTARFRIIGGRLFVLYSDYAGRLSGKTWLLEAAMEGNGRVVGRWMQVGNPSDTGPFVGVIVNDQRVDGVWSWDGRGRWNFRRRLR